MEEKVMQYAALTGIVLFVIGGVIGYIGAPDSREILPSRESCASFIPTCPEVDCPEVDCPECPECLECLEIDTNNEVLQYIYDEDGNMDFILDDLDEDELEQIPARVTAIREMKTLAAQYVKDELADEVDKEEIEIGEGNETEIIEFDEDDIDRIRVDDDLDEIEVLDVDFDYNDCELLITAEFRQDDYKFEIVFEIEIEENEVDDIYIEELTVA